MAASAGAAYALTEIARNTLVLADSLEKWLESRRQRRLKAELEKGLQQGLEQGREEGRVEGRVEERGLWQDWLARREEAEARGDTFTEPPPNGQP